MTDQTTTAYRGFYCHVCRDEKPKQEIERLRELLRGFRAHYGEPEWHDKVTQEIGPMS